MSSIAVPAISPTDTFFLRFFQLVATAFLDVRQSGLSLAGLHAPRCLDVQARGWMPVGWGWWTKPSYLTVRGKHLWNIYGEYGWIWGITVSQTVRQKLNRKKSSEVSRWRKRLWELAELSSLENFTLELVVCNGNHWFLLRPSRLESWKLRLNTACRCLRGENISH